VRHKHLRRVLAFLGPLPLGVLLVATTYMLGMRIFEGEPRDIWQSLSWAAETLTTTGYGHDNEWRHPVMILFVVGVQFIGLFLVFLVFPIFIIPFFESRFEERLPRAVPKRLHDFVLIYRYGPAVDTLIQDMKREEIPAVILEEDESVARRLRDRGFTVVLTSLDEENPLAGRLRGARALIANGEDHDNAVIVLCARQDGFEGPIYVLVENPLHREPIVLAGATAAYSPKQALAAALAAQASHSISPRVAGLAQLGERLGVAEHRIQASSPVANQTLGQARIRERTGATIVGMWMGGEFTSETSAETVLRGGSILVAVGSEESLDRLGRLATPLDRPGPYVVAGCGEVGGRVVQMLNEVGERTVTIDKVAREGVDIVADALDPDALLRAGTPQARAVILALSSDSTNLFGASIVRELAPEVPIIARVNQTQDVDRIRAAGADFALSISQVAGQLLGRRILGEEFVALESRMRVAKVSSAGLEGLDPVSARVRARTGCSIVAIERGEDLVIDFDEEMEILPGDHVYVVGTGEAVSRYFDVYPQDRSVEAA
jgi:Trk K+ transport system NAD-binding subunit